MRNGIVNSSVLLGFVLCISVMGQIGKINGDERPTGCAENEARLDQVGISVTEDVNSQSVLIILARLGDGESSLSLNKGRLYNAREYILSRFKGIRRDRIIVAEGETVAGFGRVTFYFNGKLIDQLLVKKNDRLCVDCCEHRLFPPYKSGKKSKPKS